jgi:O-acetyl-ADP-ribose deacetylase (regulator of RNase III)
MKYKIADFKDELTKLDYDVFVHGVNTKGLYRAGVAGIVKLVYPECYDLYSDEIESLNYKDGGDILPYEIKEGKVILNAFTQINPGADGSYDLIDMCFNTIGQVYSDSKICYPLIGCGIAGLNWNAVKEIINYRLSETNHTCIVRLDDVINYKLLNR